ncbi:hypothetical protein [Nitratireductor sp. OM-1]|uniref:hypothetical protein n=1 Tax=Nitratireductor sp. OM-1 TaxID=1756988 RepID=UPI000DDCF8F8|nr:hypothetical protein [Nitratireductor sp. OM-1]
MTTATQTAKMIYPDAMVANMILGKMRKRYPERKYTVMPVSGGHQIVPITVCPSAMPPKKPAPVNNKTFASAESNTLDAMVFEFPFLRQTKAWWYFDGGDVQYLHKNHCISASLVTNNDDTIMLRLKVSAKIAEEKGLIQKEAA